MHDDPQLDDKNPTKLNFVHFDGAFGAFLRCATLCSNATFKVEFKILIEIFHPSWQTRNFY